MDLTDAELVAREAAAQNQPLDYIAELVDHVTSSPSVENPAGCLRALVHQGKRRVPRGHGGVPSRAVRAMLHPEHYQPGGKYAHLFHQVQTSSAAVVAPPASMESLALPVYASPATRGPSAFAIQSDPRLAGRGHEAWPRGQPQPGAP
jgi:hypothetical protein